MVEVRWRSLRETKPHEYLVRFFLGGACTVVAGLIAKKYGAQIGGLFLAFPAIFPAGASMIESHERERKQQIGADGSQRGRLAASIYSAGAAFGCIGLTLFAGAIVILLPRDAAAFSLASASVAWFVAVCLLWELRKLRLFERWNGRRLQRPERGE